MKIRDIPFKLTHTLFYQPIPFYLNFPFFLIFQKLNPLFKEGFQLWTLIQLLLLLNNY